MQFIAKYIFLLIVSVCIKDIQCDLNRRQIWEILQNLYRLSNEQRAVTRRNIDLTLPGSGVFQEPSSRDLNVGFAVGVKDDVNDSDILNNHSSQTSLLPTSSFKPPSSDVYVTREPSSYAKELNIGVYVDPKNGVSYYTPAYAPATTYPKELATQQYLYFNPYQQPLPINPYPLTTQAPNYLQNIPNRVNWNEPTLPYRINTQQAYPYSRTQIPIYSDILNTDSNLQQPYPYMGAYKQPIDFGAYPYSSKYMPSVTNQFSEPPYGKQSAFNVFDTTPYSDNYSPFSTEERYRRSRSRNRHRDSNMNYMLPMRNLQNEFQIEEHAPRGYYNKFYQPLVAREEPQEPEIILDEQGVPMMSVQPVGDRQVGTFKLKNDHGYQVTMNVPPVPADGSKDGLLVMEMKASLYRPII